MTTKTKRRRRTKAEIRAARETEWRKLVHGHTGNYTCRWCGDAKYCRGTTKRRMACEECYLEKGPPKIAKGSK